MPIENDPLKPPPNGDSGSSLKEIRNRPRDFSPDDAEDPPARERDLFDHSCATQTLVLFVFLVSGCCTWLYFFSPFTQEPAHLSYDEDRMFARINRLYQTGYDPVMSYGARKAWLEFRGEPNLVEIGGSLGETPFSNRIVVFVKRGSVYETDFFYITHNGLIERYETNYDYGITPFFTEGAVRVDASVYPSSADHIPQEFSPR